MSDYINKIKKGEIEYDVQDARVDTLQTEVAGKQDQLTAGDNITIVNNVISASGGGGESETLIDLTSNQSATANDFLEAIGFDPNVHTSYNDALVLKNVRLKYYFSYNREILFEKINVYSQYDGSYLSFRGNTALVVGDKLGGKLYSNSGSYQTLSALSLGEFLTLVADYAIDPSISFINKFPDTNELDTSKTYVLKLVNQMGAWKMVAIEEE